METKSETTKGRNSVRFDTIVKQRGLKVYHAGQKYEWSMLVFAENRNKARYIAQQNWPGLDTPPYIEIDVWRADDDFWLFYDGHDVVDEAEEFGVFDAYEEPTWEMVLEIRKSAV